MIQKSFLTYYPRHQFPTLDTNESFVRKLILDFKKGERYAQSVFAEMAAQFLYDTFGYDEMTNLVGMCVPAHDSNVMIDRFSSFFIDLHLYTGIETEYFSIRYGCPDIPSHVRRANGEDDGMRFDYISIHEHYVKGKNVIVFDDIITTGKSMQQTIQALENAGANVVGYITLAKTIENGKERD